MESAVYLQALFYLRTAVDHGRVVAVADELANAAGRHLRVFLCQIHRHLTRHHKVALATLGAHLSLRDIVVVAHLLHDVVDGERTVVDLDGSLDDTLSQLHVDVAVIYDGVGHQRVDHTFEVAHAAAVRLGNVCDDVVGDLQSVTADLTAQDVDTQLTVGLLQRSDDTTGETGEQSVGHAFEVYRRTVGGQDDALAVFEKMVEDVEKSILCLRRVDPFLDVVDDEHVDRLIEGDEVVEVVLNDRIGELHLKETRTDIQHTLLRIEVLGVYADGIDEMRFSAARGTIDKHRVELQRVGVLGNRESHGTRQLIALSLNVVAESEMRIELRVKLGHGSVEHGRRLVGACLRLWLGQCVGRVSLNVLREVMLLVRDNLIKQFGACTKAVVHHLAEQVDEVLLQIFIYEGTRYSHLHRLGLLIVAYKVDGLKPCIIYLLGDILAYQRKTPVPTSIRTCFLHE